jgi:hypothetical protein
MLITIGISGYEFYLAERISSVHPTNMSYYEWRYKTAPTPQIWFILHFRGQLGSLLQETMVLHDSQTADWLSKTNSRKFPKNSITLPYNDAYLTLFVIKVKQNNFDGVKKRK